MTSGQGTLHRDPSPRPPRGPLIGRGTLGEPVAQVRGVLAERVIVSTELDPWMSLRALAAYSGLSVRTLRTHLADPTHPLPCYRIGGKLLVRRSDYDTWAARYRQAGDVDLDRVVAGALRAVTGPRMLTPPRDPPHRVKSRPRRQAATPGALVT